MSETVAAAIRDAAQRLAESRDTARLDAELLMAHALGTDRSSMLLRSMADPAPADFRPLIERRLGHEPVAYITGVQEFYGRDFTVSPDVLIPRGDSETLIEAALECAPKAERVLDLGTGSGALLITILLETAKSHGIGIDLSAGAVAVARVNAQALGLIGAQARFLERDWHKEGWADDLGQFDLILCNPPYVETGAKLDPDVRDHEPHTALFAGEEGLDDYRVIFPQLGKLMLPGGVAVFEIGAAQADSVAEIARNAGFEVRLRHDLANRARALILT